MSTPVERRSGLRRAASTVVTALTTVVLVAVIALACATQVVPRIMGGTSLTVLTGSMVPTFNPGDVIAVAKVDPSEVKVGDIVTFQPVSDDPTLITHRVVAKGVAGDGSVQFTTQGDANGAADEPIEGDQIKARYLYHLPWLGHVVGPLDGRGPLVATGIAICLIAYGIWCFLPRPRGRRPGRRRADDASAPRSARVPVGSGTAVLVLLAVVGAGALVVAGGAPARADGVDVQFAGPTVQVDYTGQPFSTLEPSFFGTRVLSPGDRIARRTRITNSYADAGLLTVNLRDVVIEGALPAGATLRWRIGDDPQSRDLSTIVDGTTALIDKLEIAPGESVELTLELDYPVDAGNEGRTAVQPYAFSFNVEYLLRQARPGQVGGVDATPTPAPGDTLGVMDGDAGDLPDTGSRLEWWQIALGVGSLLAGSALLAVARRRRDEEPEESDEPAQEPGSMVATEAATRAPNER